MARTRKPYVRTSTKTPVISITNQTQDSTDQQYKEDNSARTELTDIATALQNVQQAPVPQARPSRKRPQVVRPSSQYRKVPATTTTTTTQPPLSSSYKTTYVPVTTKHKSKKTVAITLPFARGSTVAFGGSTMADQFVTTAAQGLSAQEYLNRYTSQTRPAYTRSRYSGTTEIPIVLITPGSSTTRPSTKRKPFKTFDKIGARSEDKEVLYKLQSDYDYYDNLEASVIGKIPEHSKVLLHSDGIIECLDQGNFPHPISCKKFISCAKMDNDKIFGWEYTCPKNLSFDPIGGMCNWSAGLGCNEA
ncbi:uncharacterized protein LOC126739986 [Anthonomus grandis grandis]|uniref:uncharacterized protein LOC126739986 n=1 Tax=Anthonomus grandis grandis TaxID=2921223 RepID=UPI002165025B|nr:uncharacterized protein LOC126739986 [Anthonomus grandis grandis]